MGFDFDLQLFGGGGGGGGGHVEQIKQSAPGSTAAATIDSATEGDRQKVREKLAKARGRDFTNTGAAQKTTDFFGSIKKALLGE
jgi:hypothetical protein